MSMVSLTQSVSKQRLNVEPAQQGGCILYELPLVCPLMRKNCGERTCCEC